MANWFSQLMNQLDHYLRSLAQFTDHNLHQISSRATPLTIHKRKLLLREGEVCRHKVFVLSGLLRIYRVGNDGSESIMRFSTENEWAIDHESYVNRTPSHYRIDALEDTSVLLWTREVMDELFEAMPTFRLLSDRLREKTFDKNIQRIYTTISYTAEEKYDAFVAEYPDVFRRVPLHMVASYLGVTRETLSRIRQKNHQLR